MPRWPYKTIGATIDRVFRNNMNDNFKDIEADFKELNTNFDNAVETVSDKAFNKVVGAAKIEWLPPVNTFNDLEITYPDVVEGKTVMTRDSGKIYRFDGENWIEIQDIDPSAINEVDNRLTAELATMKTHQTDWITTQSLDDFSEVFGLSERTAYIPSGTYNFSNLIINKKSKRFIGNNAKFIFDSSLDVGIQSNDSLDYLEFEDIDFSGSKVSRLLYIDNCKKVVFKNCKFSDIGRNSLVVYNADEVIIKECSFENIRGNAVVTRNCKSVVFKWNKGKDIGIASGYREGSIMHVSKCMNVTITHNETENNLDSAIYANHCTGGNVLIAFNKIKMCYKESIKNQNSSSKTIIQGNIIEGCLGNGIIAHYCSNDVTITENQVYDSCLYSYNDVIVAGGTMGAIVVSNTLNAIISKNLIKRVKNEGANGIRLQNYTDHSNLNKRITVTDNIITDTAGIGFYAESVDMLNANGNTITNCFLNSTGWSVMMHLDTIKGNVNNNIFKQHSITDDNCTILSNNTAQLPLGLVSVKSIYENMTIKLYVTDNNNTEINVITTISSFDTSTNIATVDADLSSLISLGSNVLFVIYTNCPKLNYILRFYRGVKCNVIGNYIEKPEETTNYRNDNINADNVITQRLDFASYNTVITTAS